MSESVRPHRRQPIRLLRPWDSPGKNTGGGCHFLLQGDLPDPGREPKSPALAGRFSTTESPGKPHINQLKMRPLWWSSSSTLLPVFAAQSSWTSSNLAKGSKEGRSENGPHFAGEIHVHPASLSILAAALFVCLVSWTIK